MSETDNRDPFGAELINSGADKEFLIVGLGASAGGLTALRDFFANVPPDSGMAYVVILHLSPDHDSMLASVLQRAVAVPVTQVEHQVRVEPDHAYVIPPNKSLRMRDGLLDLADVTGEEARRAPVDIFFRTLAEAHGARAVSVILSGTGADGSTGMKRVKEMGGLCIVQDPREAEFDDVARHSLATGLVDYALPAAEIPARIIAYREQLRRLDVTEGAAEQVGDEADALRDIFTQLRVRTGHDFSDYKRPTVLRRVARRMGVHQLDSLTAYARFMREHPQEAHSLLKDLLISVTNFFRDPAALERLERGVVPRLFADKTAGEQRTPPPSYPQLHQRLLERYAPPSVVVSEDYDVVHMSETAGRFMELRGGEPSANLLRLVRDELRPELRAALSQATHGKADADSRAITLTLGGETRLVRMRVRPALNDGDESRGFLLVLFDEPAAAAAPAGPAVAAAFTDIHDEHLDRAHLRASADNLQQVMDGVTDFAVIMLDAEGHIESWNTGAERIFGFEAEEAVGRHTEIFFTLEDRRRGRPAEEMRLAREHGRAADERWHLRKDGSRVFVSGVLSPTGETMPTGYVKIARDLTVQKHAEEELRQAHAELEDRVRERTLELARANEALRDEISERIQTERSRVRLLREIVRAQEDERRRIARDIHDQLGQQMTALRLSLDALHQGCNEDEAVRARLEQTQKLAERLDADVDFLAWELRPAALDDLGLVAALENFVREWSRHSGVAAEFHTTGMEAERLAPEAESALYRITQEALNNAMKYARAARVDVLLERRGQQVVLIVEDDGVGFDPRRAVQEGTGLGLVGMRERATLVGGTLEVESRPGEGTAVFARVPVRFLEGEDEE